MNNKVKIAWAVFVVSVVGLVVPRFIFGAWMDWMWAPLITSLVALIAALALNIKFYIEFLSLKTTKNGMNMGVLIVLWLVALACANVLSMQYNKTWDVTSEGMFSLAEQSQKVLKSLEDDAQITVFYPGQQEGQNFRQQMKRSLQFYHDRSSKIKTRFVDPYTDVALATEYLSRSDGAQAVFVDYKDKRLRIDRPYQEAQITTALIKATRKSSRKVYFLQGHGEKRLDDTQAKGLSSFKQALVDSSYDLMDLNLIQDGKLPDDADLIVIISPQTQLQTAEVELIKQHLDQGGQLFMALDPGVEHNLDVVLQHVGLEHLNNVLIMSHPLQLGRGVASVFGTSFDPQHAATQSFEDNNTVTQFHLVSELKATVDMPEGVQTFELVKSFPRTFSVPNLKLVKDRKSWSPMGPKTLVMASEKSHADPDPEEDAKPPAAKTSFRAVLAGDGDFVSNSDFGQGYNRDLALNLISYLLQEDDLISIRPKRPKGTQMSITSTTRNIIVVAGMSLPILLFCFGGWFYVRRRGA